MSCLLNTAGCQLAGSQKDIFFIQWFFEVPFWLRPTCFIGSQGRWGTCCRRYYNTWRRRKPM